MLLWAGSFPAIAIGVRHVDPAALAAVRFAVAGTVLGAWLLWRGGPLPSPPEMVRVAACGLLGIALYNVLVNFGQRTVSPGAASFIISTQSLFAAALAHVLRQQRVGPAAVVGMGIGLAGVAIISIDGMPDAGFEPAVGTPLILLAAACSGATFVLQRPLAVKYGAARSAGWTLLAGALLLLPWLPAGVEQASRSTEALLAVAFLALASGVVAYACWMIALSGLGAARAANLLVLMAPLALVMAIPITGHLPDPATILGGAAALAGVLIVNSSYRRGPASLSEY